MHFGMLERQVPFEKLNAGLSMKEERKEFYLHLSHAGMMG